MNKIISKMGYTNRLMEINKLSGSAYSNVSKCLYNKIKNNQKISKASELAQEVSVSNALITKFLKFIAIDGWHALKYIHNSVIDNLKTLDPQKNQKILQAANAIVSARKVFFVGVSTLLFSNKDFALKLSRLDKWVVTPISKYEQCGLSKLLVEQDILIVSSISFQHSWMREIIRNTKAKIIVISANNDILKDEKIDYSFLINPNRHDVTQTRTFTTYARRMVIKIFDDIYEYLISQPENANLLRLTSYN